MITPLLHITLPEDDGDDAHFAPIQLALNAMVSINEWHIRRALKRARLGLGEPIPPIYASGVYYEEDPAGREDWRDCLAVLERGKGDCDQVVAWRTAELRVAGINAEPVIKWQHIPQNVALSLGYSSDVVPPQGFSMVHCSVGWPGWRTNGHVEDVSKNLGMGGNYTNGI